MAGLREVSLRFLRDLFAFDQAHPLLFTQLFLGLLRHCLGFPLRIQEQGAAEELLPVLRELVLLLQDQRAIPDAPGLRDSV